MRKILNFREYKIEEILTDREVNYVVNDKEGYVCRLVPGYAGFEISQHDKALNNYPPDKIITSISDFIVENE